MGMKNPAALLGYFTYTDLPDSIREVGAELCSLADKYDSSLPDCAEKSVGLRKLLEARDCLLRAAQHPPHSEK